MLKWVCLAAVLMGCGGAAGGDEMPQDAPDAISTHGSTEATGGSDHHATYTPPAAAGAPAGGAGGAPTYTETCHTCSHTSEGGGGSAGAAVAAGAGGVTAGGAPAVAGAGGAADIPSPPKACASWDEMHGVEGVLCSTGPQVCYYNSNFTEAASIQTSVAYCHCASGSTAYTCKIVTQQPAP